ncbi:MAG: DUF1467 family protein [Nitratireductor sp.]
MAPLTLFAYYVLFWWLTLFAVLSIGLKTQGDEGEVTLGTSASAPAKPRIWRALLINTILSATLFGLWYYVTQVLNIGVAELRAYLPSRNG